PLQMSLMALGTVLVLGDGVTSPATAQVRSDSLALVKDLHRGWGGADFHDLLHQSVGHTVEVLVESDVVVDVDGGPRPLAHVETLGGQGRQSRFFQAVEQAGPRSVTLAEQTLVQSHQQLPDRLVEFRQAEELPVLQRRYDPAFAYLHSAFYFRLVTGFVWTRRHHAHPVMHGELLIRGIEIGIVAAGASHCRLRVLGYRQSLHSP